MDSSRPINEITGVKKPSSVLVRGYSHMEIAKQLGLIPNGWTEAEYVEWAKGPRGYSTFELWQQEPGNENMTLEDFFDWLGFVEASQEAAIIAQVDAAKVAAEAARDAAGVHENNAETAETNAETAQAAAEAAQAAAEAAAASIVGGSLAQGAIFGLRTSPNAVNPTTRIDIAVGQCRSSDNAVDIILGAAITKRLDAVWAAGTGNGGRDVATALALGQTWHVHLIYDDNDPDPPTIDALFSLSPDNPTLPAGYTKFRRIWSLPALGYDVIPAAGTNIPNYLQYDDICKLIKRTSDYTGQTGNTSPQLKTFAVLPLGIKVETELYLQNSGDGSTAFLRVTDPDRGVPAAFGGSDQWGQIRLSTNELYLTMVSWEPCNTARQLYVHASYSAAIWAAGVLGWRDHRGAM